MTAASAAATPCRMVNCTFPADWSGWCEGHRNTVGRPHAYAPRPRRRKKRPKPARPKKATATASTPPAPEPTPDPDALLDGLDEGQRLELARALLDLLGLPHASALLYAAETAVTGGTAPTHHDGTHDGSRASGAAQGGLRAPSTATTDSTTTTSEETR